MTNCSPCPRNGNTNPTMSLMEDIAVQRQQRPFSEWPEIMNHTDLMSFAGLTHAQAWSVLKSKSIYRPFPNEKRGMVIGKYALRDYLNGRQILEVF